MALIKLLFAGALLFSFNAGAEWVYIQNSEVGQFYYDPSSIVQKGGYIEVLTLFDIKGPHTVLGRNVGSLVGADIYDCKKRRAKSLKIADYSEQQGKGEVIDSFVIKRPKWQPTLNGTNSGALYEILCMPAQGVLSNLT